MQMLNEVCTSAVQKSMQVEKLQEYTRVSEDEISKPNPYAFIQMEISHPGVQSKQRDPLLKVLESLKRVKKEKIFD